MSLMEPDGDQLGGMSDGDSDNKQGLGQRLASLKAALAKRSGIKKPGALAASINKRKKNQSQLSQLGG